MTKLVVQAPARLDAFLSVQTGRSRNFIKIQILKGRVQVNGEAVQRPATRIRPADVVSYEFVEENPLTLEPVEKPLSILYEDDDLLILNKEQGWVVHPASAHRGETVVHYLLHHFQSAPGFVETSPTRPGIVHRLDRGTSGCLLIAKNRPALERLSHQFKEREVEKEYEAIVWGKSKPQGVIKSVIGRHRSDRKRMSSKTHVGKDAETRYETKETFSYFSWLRLLPKTGRTHQLRVHLSELGHALVGDPLYGKRRNLDHLPPDLKALLLTVSHPYLHARRLVITHPVSGKRIEVVAERPPIFEKTLELLRRGP